MARATRKKAVSAGAVVLGPTPERTAKGASRLVDVELENNQDRRAKVHQYFAGVPIDEWRTRGIITEQQAPRL